MQKRQVHATMTPDERKDALAAFKWGWFKRKGYNPSAPQLDVHLSQARFRTALAGTRGGKSRCVGEEASAYLLIGATRVWLVGQTYSTTEKEFRYIWDALHCDAFKEIYGEPKDMLIKDIYNEKGGDMQMQTIWGSEVKCISLDQANTAAFGEEVDLLVLCEPAQIKNPEYVWDRILFGRLASRKGDMLMGGTPAGKKPRHDSTGWLYNMYIKGLVGTEDYDPDYFTRIWSSWENPYFADDPYWIRSWMNPLIFAEQYEASFITLTGNIFTAFNPVIHVIPPFKIPSHWNRYEAIDPGFSGLFYWCSGATGHDGALYIFDEYFDTEKTYAERANAIWEKRLATYNLPFKFASKPQTVDSQNMVTWQNAISAGRAPSVRQLYIDPEDPQFILEISKYGLAGLKANNDVLIGINRIDQLLKHEPPQLYITANCVRLIEALGNHAWGEKNTGDTRKPANDVYKHPCDTLRYMVMGSLSPSEDKEIEIANDEYGDRLDDILENLWNNADATYVRDPYRRRQYANGSMF